MKNQPLFLTINLLLIFSICSCINISPSYKTSNHYFDEFKKLNTKTFKEYYRPLESNSAIEFLELEMLYHKTDFEDTLKIFLNIKRKHPSQEIEKYLYLKTDRNEIEKIRINRVNSTFQKETLLETNSSSSIDTSGVTSTTESKNIIEKTWIDDNYITTISSDIILKIDESDKISFRIYSGAVPSTFELKGNNLLKFKEFINRLEE